MEKRKPPNRKRENFRALYFSDDEWKRVESGMRRAGMSNFSAYARQMILKGKIAVDNHRLDVVELNRQLAPIGNNINQIARYVNTEHFASVSTLEEVLAEVRRVGDILHRYMDEKK